MPDQLPARDIVTRPLAAGDWALIEQLFGAKGACGGCGGCWCMWWRVQPPAQFAAVQHVAA